MYEIWLALNILWEIALELRVPLLGAALLWAVLLLLAWQRGGRWRAALWPAAGLAALIALAAFLSLPSLSQSSFAEMGYWVDWANLGAMAAGIGCIALAFAWPALALRRGPAARH